MPNAIISERHSDEPKVQSHGFFKKVKEEHTRQGPIVEWEWEAKTLTGGVTARGKGYDKLDDALAHFLDHHGVKDHQPGELVPEGFSPFIQGDDSGNIFRIDVFEKA